MGMMKGGDFIYRGWEMTNIIYYISAKRERADIPWDVTSVKVNPSVTALNNFAFSFCRQLTTMTGFEGLEEIGHKVFIGCTWLHELLGCMYFLASHQQNLLAFSSCWRVLFSDAPTKNIKG
jgi:hypothetical protein